MKGARGLAERLPAYLPVYILSASVFLPRGAWAANDIDLGNILPLWSTLPFVGMLLSIASFPLVAPKFWHDHFGKTSLFWALTITVPFLIVYRAVALQELLHIVLDDYVPFIILLGSLYTVSGGILLKGSMRGTPLFNTGMLLVGAILASWMGTTGAAMLLIRPFIRANNHRKEKTFMVVFFIFLVANVGGSLTPLGDPPLFLGFLRGVPFFWTFHLLPHASMVVAILIAIYFIMDSYFYRKEGLKGRSATAQGEQEVPFGIDGGHNFIFLAGIIGAVLMSGLAKWGEVSILGIPQGVQDILRDVILVLMALLSLLTTRKRIREDNEFTWFPIKEVAILFAGIFLTMVPCLKILQAGSHGALAFLIETVKEPHHYFWVTGSLSSFLDNAPTYLTFLNTAIGGLYTGVPASEAVALLIKEKPLYLEAISSSAVFFGALTYIGNAPNFMVRSIAEESGIPMPSFFGYMLKYSLAILLPVFIVINLVFF
jgi:Na+/H+ antiporter NhaD/arsenite permease-like protein